MRKRNPDVTGSKLIKFPDVVGKLSALLKARFDCIKRRICRDTVLLTDKELASSNLMYGGQSAKAGIPCYTDTDTDIRDAPTDSYCPPLS